MIRNPTDADYYNGFFPITVPCDGMSATGHGIPYPTTVRMARIRERQALGHHGMDLALAEELHQCEEILPEPLRVARPAAD